MQCRSVSNGLDAIRAFAHCEYDLVITDLEMPRLGAKELTRSIRQHNASVPVVMITGRKERWLERKVIGMGAAKFMNKPPVFEELLDELRKHIDVLPQPA